MKKLKSIIRFAAVPVLIALAINTFVLGTVKVSAKVLDEYQVNNIVLFNKISKNVKVGDIVVFKHNNDTLIRKVINVDNNNIIVSDKDNNTISIEKVSIIGKTICKLY